MKFFLTTAFALCVALGTQAQSNTWFTGSTNQTQSVDLSTSGSNPTFNPLNSSLNSGNSNSSYRYQNSYTRRDGTVVRGHYRTNANDTNWDNFSTSGNSNPFTGSTGYRAQDYSVGAYNYGSGQTIYQGSRGGQYYINSNGNRTYVPKRR